MLTELDSLKSEALAALDTLTDEATLEAFRIDYLGKKASSPPSVLACVTCPSI